MRKKAYPPEKLNIHNTHSEFKNLSMKYILFAAILLLSLNLTGQVQFGLFAGPQATTVRYVIEEEKQDNSFKYGFQVGGLWKVPFEGRLYFSPSIQYNLRGYKVKFNKPSFPPNESAVDNNTSFHTIELGFLLQHDFSNAPSHWFFRIGPSLDFALFGKEEFNTSNNGIVKQDMKFSFADYGHFLASAIAQLGYESSSGVFIYAHYNYSLTTMNNADIGPAINNRAIGISIGKYFKSKKLTKTQQ